jgi:endonuclease/exonuclease/phosphatase family metal-dependent hydrolase
MKLITWNIQWGCGLDGRVDLRRIVRTARAMADFDVLCVQEVADNFPDLEGSDERDQFAELAALLPGFTPVRGYGIDVAGDGERRRRFGNAIFSRPRVLAARRHALPWPADPGKTSMPRVAVEATLDSAFGPLRVTTTHLEYFSAVQRQAQARALRDMHAEACERSARPPGRKPGSNATFEGSPQTDRALLVGDFNFPPGDPAFALLQAPLEGAGPGYRDGWSLLHPGVAHVATFCVHSDKYAKTPYCCDFAFVSETLAPRLRAVVVDSATQASDHQPVLVELDDAPEH